MGQAPRSTRIAIRALILVCLHFLCATAGAQNAERLATQDRVQGAKQQEASPENNETYQDRLIDGLSTPTSDDSADSRVYNADGPLRFMRLETRLSMLPFKPRNRAYGVRFVGGIETRNHGVINLDLEAGEKGTPHFSLRQRGLPLPGSWLVDNDIGQLSPALPEVMRLPSRVFVPAAVQRGAGTAWRNAATGMEWAASVATPGRLVGYPVAVFQRDPGRLYQASVGHADSEWQWGARVSRAAGIVSPALGGAARTDMDAYLISARHAGQGYSVMANLVGTRLSGFSTNQGVWLDIEQREPGMQRTFGGYHLEPNLGWAGQAMAAGLKGAFARQSWQSRRSTLNVSLDWLRSMSGARDQGLFSTASGYWRQSRDVTFGGGLAVRRFGGNGESLFADVRVGRGRSLTGARIDLVREPDRADHTLTLDRTWDMVEPWMLSTSLFGGRETGALGRGNHGGFANTFFVPLFASASLSGSQFSDWSSDDRTVHSLNMSLLWRLSPQWSLEGTVNLTSGRRRVIASLDPLAPRPDIDVDTNSRSYFISIRYEDRAGSRDIPLGGMAGAGGGSLEGVVYFDHNRNGERDAGEEGVADVMVLMDNRFVARTDAHGRFDFPFVSAGERLLSTQNESLPLPWIGVPGRSVQAQVPLRGTVRVNIPVVRRGA